MTGAANQRLLALIEHRSSPLEDDWVTAVPESFWTATKCTVTRSPGDHDWQVAAEGYVGVARVRTDLGYLTVHIRPKLAGCNPFFLADYAYGQRHEPLLRVDSDQALLEALSDDPAACLLMWHVRAIDRFARRWLRRDYQANTKVFNGKVKGKLLLGRYVTQHVAFADAASVPCKVVERTQDTPNNRVLKAGLRRVAVLARQLPVPAAEAAVVRAVNAALPRFSQVTDIRVRPSDIRATSTKGPQRHYADVLRSTLGLLAGEFLSGAPGATTEDSFLWSMPVLFQEAVRGVLNQADGIDLVELQAPVAEIFDPDGVRRTRSKVDPDFVLRGLGGRTLLLDTKYKNALPDGAATDEEVVVTGGRRIKVSRSDVYQLVAYREHDRWAGAASAALLYPVVLAENEPLPAPYEVRGFGEPVQLLFIDVGPRARVNLPAFSAQVGTTVTPAGPALSVA